MHTEESNNPKIKLPVTEKGVDTTISTSNSTDDNPVKPIIKTNTESGEEGDNQTSDNSPGREQGGNNTETNKGNGGEEGDNKAKEEGDESNKDTTNEENKVEIDGKIYTINEAGNAIADDGAIAFTADDIAKMQEATENDDIINFETLEKLSGIKLPEDVAKTIKSDWSLEALAEREVAVKRLGEQEGFQKGFNRFLQDNPDVADIIRYKENYGTVEGYDRHVDYTKMDTPEEETLQYDIVYKAEIKKGNSPERAKRIADFEKANNSLKAACDESIDYMAKLQASEQAAIAEQDKAKAQAELQKEIQFYGADFSAEKPVMYNVEGSLYDMIVNKNTIGDFKLPKEGLRVTDSTGKQRIASLDEVYLYMSAPAVEVGDKVLTKAEYDLMQLFNNPSDFALAAINNLCGGFNQLVKKSIETEKVNTIKKLKTTQAKPSTGTVNRGDANKGVKKLILPVQ